MNVQQWQWHDQNIFAISVRNDLCFWKFVILSIIHVERKKWDQEYEVEDLLTCTHIAVLINKQQYCTCTMSIKEVKRFR